MFVPPIRQRPSASAAQPAAQRAPSAPGTRTVTVGRRRNLLALPFDAMRLHYAGAVAVGLVRRSIVASGQLERALDQLEQLILGPLARRR